MTSRAIDEEAVSCMVLGILNATSNAGELLFLGYRLHEGPPVLQAGPVGFGTSAADRGVACEVFDRLCERGWIQTSTGSRYRLTKTGRQALLEMRQREQIASQLGISSK